MYEGISPPQLLVIAPNPVRSVQMWLNLVKSLGRPIMDEEELKAINKETAVMMDVHSSTVHRKEDEKVSRGTESVFVAPYPKTSFTEKLVRSIATNAVGAKALTKASVLAILKSTESFLRLFLERVEGICRRDDEWFERPVGKRMRQVDVIDLLRAVEPVYARDKPCEDDCRFEMLERMFRENVDMQMRKRRQSEAASDQKLEQHMRASLEHFFLKQSLSINTPQGLQGAGEHQHQPRQAHIARTVSGSLSTVTANVPPPHVDVPLMAGKPPIPSDAPRLDFSGAFHKEVTRMHLAQYHELRTALNAFRQMHYNEAEEVEGEEPRGQRDQQIDGRKAGSGAKRQKMGDGRAREHQILWSRMETGLLARLVHDQKRYFQRVVADYDRDLLTEMSNVEALAVQEEKDEYWRRFHQGKLDEVQAALDARRQVMEEERVSWLNKYRDGVEFEEARSGGKG